MFSTIAGLLSLVLGDQLISKILLLGIEWFLEKKKTDRESRELAVSLAMSLRRQGVADVVLSFNSAHDAEAASNEWEKIELAKIEDLKRMGQDDSR